MHLEISVISLELKSAFTQNDEKYNRKKLFQIQSKNYFKSSLWNAVTVLCGKLLCYGDTSKCYDDSIHLFHGFKLLSQCMGRIPGKLLPEAERKWQVSQGFSHNTEGQLND